MSISFDYDLAYPGPAFPVVKVAILGETERRVDALTALVDTGADATIIPLEILRSVGARRIDTRIARNVDGTRYRVRLFAVTIVIGSFTLHGIDAVANEATQETIIGRDVLNQLLEASFSSLQNKVQADGPTLN